MRKSFMSVPCRSEKESQMSQEWWIEELEKQGWQVLQVGGQPATPFVWKDVATLPLRTEEERKKYDTTHPGFDWEA